MIPSTPHVKSSRAHQLKGTQTASLISTKHWHPSLHLWSVNNCTANCIIYPIFAIKSLQKTPTKQRCLQQIACG